MKQVVVGTGLGVYFGAVFGVEAAEAQDWDDMINRPCSKHNLSGLGIENFWTASSCNQRRQIRSEATWLHAKCGCIRYLVRRRFGTTSLHTRMCLNYFLHIVIEKIPNSSSPPTLEPNDWVDSGKLYPTQPLGLPKSIPSKND